MIVNWCWDSVEEKAVVSVCRLLIKPSSTKVLAFQAVRIPPRVPVALTKWIVLAKFGGRKLRAWNRLIWCNLVS